ncbi:MAG: hypothetical protein AABZ60_21115 [Planctomycetota bacterium]
MRYSNVCIEAVAGEIPKQVVTSKSIEEQLKPVYEQFKIPVGSLEHLTGIRERRFWENGVFPSHASVWAAEKALQQTGINPDLIGCVFHCGNSRDFLEPATAVAVHQRLKLSSRAMVLDISNAHLGFMNGVLTAANLIELGQTQAALIVSSETCRETVESQVEGLIKNPSMDRYYSTFPTLTFGDGSVAMLLTHRKISRTGHQLVGGTVHCSGSQTLFSHLRGNQIPQFFQKRLRLLKEVWQHFMSLINWTPEIIQKTFHQIIDPKGRFLQLLNLNTSQNFSVTEQLGNLRSLGAPMALVKGLEQQQCLDKGDCFALLGLGFDLDCLMLGAVWN